ncbi:unnamed protein product, partial [Lymnaea stagnalis]
RWWIRRCRPDWTRSRRTWWIRLWWWIWWIRWRLRRLRRRIRWWIRRCRPDWTRSRRTWWIRRRLRRTRRLRWTRRRLRWTRRRLGSWWRMGPWRRLRLWRRHRQSCCHPSWRLRLRQGQQLLLRKEIISTFYRKL